MRYLEPGSWEEEHRIIKNAKRKESRRIKSSMHKKFEGEIRPLAMKAAKVVCNAVRGLHHFSDAIEDYGFYVECKFPQHLLATCDYDVLTRMVINCHDLCVRMEINAQSNGYIKLRFHDRKREGEFSKRHPTIDEAIKTARDFDYPNGVDEGTLRYLLVECKG